jgi:hypothetical protein
LSREEDNGKYGKDRVGESGAREDEEWSDKRKADAEAPVLHEVAQLIDGAGCSPDVIDQRLEDTS